MKIKRDELINQIVQAWLDAIDINDLMQFFMGNQTEFLEQQVNSELLINADECGIEVTEII